MAKTQLTANQLAAPAIIKFFVWVVILGVVGYSEVLYLGIVGVLFPAGVMYAACILGAFATGISILCLYAGKAHWFRPGPQLMCAWFFTGLEVIILILNDVLAMAIHNGGQLDQYLSLYKFFVPAIPVLSLIGWGVLLFLDPALRLRHARMEMDDRQQAQLLEFEQAQFEAKLDVQYKALNIMKERLAAQVANDVSFAHIEAGAISATREAISQLTGHHFPVNSSPPSPQNTEPLSPVEEKPSKK